MTCNTRLAPAGLVIRRREERDLPALEALLAKQQPQSEYPLEWPLPFSTRSFIIRDNELCGWVAELDGKVAGHVSVTGVNEVQGGDKMSAAWEAAHGGVTNAELRQIAVFFTDLDHSGSGIGHHLFAVACDYALHDGYPVLDAVVHHPGPVNFYRKRGWEIVAEQVAPWDPSERARVYLMILSRNKALAGRLKDTGSHDR